MDKLFKILKRVIPEVDFTYSRGLVYEGVLDSIDIVSIISEIEEEYGIEIDPDEIEPNNFQSAEAMMEMIQKAIR